MNWTQNRLRAPDARYRGKAWVQDTMPWYNLAAGVETPESYRNSPHMCAQFTGFRLCQGVR